MFSLRLGSVSSLRAERRPALVSSRRHLALAVEGSPAGWAMPGSHMVTFSVNSKSQTVAVKASLEQLLQETGLWHLLGVSLVAVTT